MVKHKRFLFLLVIFFGLTIVDLLFLQKFNSAEAVLLAKVNPLPPEIVASSAPTCVIYGTKYRFSATFKEPNGFIFDQLSVNLIINTAPNANTSTLPVGAFQVFATFNEIFNKPDFQIRNASDTGWLPLSKDSNGYATLDRTTSFVEFLDPITARVNWDITFLSTWTPETANFFVRARDSDFLDTGYQDRGDVQIPCPKPDLTITGSLDKTNVIPGETIIATVLIKNLATTSTGDKFWADFYKNKSSNPVCNDSIGDELTGDLPIIINGSPLGPLVGGGSLGPFSVSFTAPSTPGNYTARAFVDSHNSNPAYCAIDEDNESNNILLLPYKVSIPPAPDLVVSFKNQPPAPPATVTARSDVSVSVTVTNQGTAATTTSFIVSVYPNRNVVPPSCPGTLAGSGSANITTPIAGGGGFLDDIPITFTAPDTPGTYIALAYVDSFCTVSESNPLATGEINNTADSTSYTVSGRAAWFKVVNGDVGLKGSINITAPPPPGEFHSTYLGLAGASLDSDFVSQNNWKIGNYGTWNLLRSTYAYFDHQFGSTAANCDAAVGCENGDLPDPGGVYKYTGQFVWDNDTPQSGPVFVLIIDGNMKIQKNLTGRRAVYIVSGDIEIHKNVTEVQGFFIAGGTLTTKAPGGGPGVDCQLQILGGIVAHGRVSLPRDLGNSSTCPGPNDSNPAELVTFDPGYLVEFVSLLGTPSYNWREVAP